MYNIENGKFIKRTLIKEMWGGFMPNSNVVNVKKVECSGNALSTL